MTYQYGEIFKRLGIPGMGHQGATWCELDPKGTLVLMAHLNYFRMRPNKTMYYEVNAQVKTSTRASSAIKSLKMIQSYVEHEKSVLLLVAEFIKDGGLRPDGTFESSEFKHATGSVYRAIFTDFRYETGYIHCEVDAKSKFNV